MSCFTQTRMKLSTGDSRQVGVSERPTEFVARSAHPLETPPMWLISVSIFGLSAGLLARLLRPSGSRMSWLWSIVLGLTGALIGGCTGKAFGLDIGLGASGWAAVLMGVFVPLLLLHLASSPTPAPAGVSTIKFNEYPAAATHPDLSSRPNA
jgi:uncharacterized membrane protein YeaQ/YmgE (transglycosylase-associated protein family)